MSPAAGQRYPCDMPICPQCGEFHDLSKIEPSFRRPDALLPIPLDQRPARVRDSDEGCLISSEDGQNLRSFVRTVLRVPLRGEPGTIAWGVWVELSPRHYFELVESSDQIDQPMTAPFPSTLANEIPGYSGTLNLPGHTRLVSPHLRPVFALSPDLDHPFAREAREGVHAERAMEWRFRAVHPPEVDRS
jgi:hypothetical protein